MTDDKSYPTADSAKPRLPVLLCGMSLVSIAYGYSLAAAPGLLILSSLTTIAATLSPRRLPATMRAMIWGLLVMALLSAAANIRHLTPDNETFIFGMPAYSLERVATIAFAIGLTALLFHPSRDTITLTLLAVIPLAVMAMERSREAEQAGVVSRLAILSLLLVALAAQTERASFRHSRAPSRQGFSLWLPRILLTTVWIAMAASLTAPLEQTAGSLRHWLYRLAGLELPEREKPRLFNRSLAMMPPPGNWNKRTRIILEIDAPRAPGYLREAVYRTYGFRQWVGRSRATHIPTELPQLPATGNTGWSVYALAPVTNITPHEVWSFRPWRRQSLSSFCLPGATMGFTVPPGAAPVTSPDGIAMLDNAPCPSAYQAIVTPFLEQMPPFTAIGDSAFPWPDPQDDPGYLAIPPHLAPAVSNWNSNCFGAGNPQNTSAATTLLTGYFHNNFTYRLATDYNRGKTDPVTQFMENRAGHCTLFATAAALMLRQKNIPTRIVAGYLCTERHPYTRRWVVREREGHAWCEAWDRDRQQWLLVEATPDAGIPAALKPPYKITILGEWLASLWRTALAKLQAAAPLLALAAFLAGMFHWLWALLQTRAGLMATLLLLLAVLLWRCLKRSAPKESAEEKLRRLLAARMTMIERRHAPPHLRRLPHEPWQLWLQRISPSLPQKLVENLSVIVAEYQALRYRPSPDTAAAQRWLRKTSHLP